jgi:proteasome assembly chaperone (PAC2) family protein
MRSITAPQSISVKEGIVSHPDLPRSTFHYRYDPDVIIFESDTQVSGKEGVAVVEAVLEIARRFRVRQVYTAAAYAEPMSHTSPSRVYCASTNQRLLQALESFGAQPIHEGQIAGLNGLLLGVAADHSMDAACILATMPSYAGPFSYPKASLEIVKLIGDVLSVPLDLAELEAAAGTTDEVLEAIEKRIREYFPAAVSQDEELPTELKEDEVPNYVMERIENLFKEVADDRSRAPELKEELDRWNLYELYEDRFLDLFRSIGEE